MHSRYKKIMNTRWNISYLVHQQKIIEVLFSAKDTNLIGWCQRLQFAVS